MVREIVFIDEEKCNGCGDCIPSCHEGAIALVDGKAKLMGDSLCDGLGACLGHCPQDAITIESREASGFVEPPETRAHGDASVGYQPPTSCPGSRAMAFQAAPARATEATNSESALSQWPVQLHLASPMAPYFKGQDVLLSADCVAYALGNFHGQLLSGKKLLIACPKLDQGQEIYLDKLVALFDQAQINTLTIARMEVPCCGGLVAMAMEAARRAERRVPIKEIMVSVQGEIQHEQWVEV